MKFLIESGESSLTIYRESESIVIDVNGQKIAVQGVDLVDFDNLIGNLSSTIAKQKEQETPLIKKIERIWKQR